MAQQIFPSVMAKNQKELNQLLKKLHGVAKTLHLDIVDGKFAPSFSLHFPFKLSKKFNYNAHLMVKKPEVWITKYGHKVNKCIVQLEEIKDVKKYLEFCKQHNNKPCFALKPETKIDMLKPFIKKIHTILILTVKPGFYGSPYQKKPLQKIKQLKKLHPKIKIIVDGHMNPTTILDAKKAGADYYVSGSFVTKSDDSTKAIKELKKKLK